MSIFHKTILDITDRNKTAKERYNIIEEHLKILDDEFRIQRNKWKEMEEYFRYLTSAKMSLKAFIDTYGSEIEKDPHFERVGTIANQKKSYG